MEQKTTKNNENFLEKFGFEFQKESVASFEIYWKSIEFESSFAPFWLKNCDCVCVCDCSVVVCVTDTWLCATSVSFCVCGGCIDCCDDCCCWNEKQSIW